MLNKFKPKVLAKNLIRLGPRKDSGYVLHKNILKNNSIFLLSLGVGFEIGFEKDIIKKFRSKKIVLVDYSSSDFAFILSQFSLLIKLKLYRFLANIYRYIFYKKFMIKSSKNIDFLSKYVNNYNDKRNIEFHQILQKYKSYIDKELSILKIDIERSEYKILNENSLKLISKYFQVVLIEFHGLITFHEKINQIDNLFKKNNFFVGHYHNNNTVPFHKKYNMSNCFEVTYLCKSRFLEEEIYDQEYPLKNLDFSCNPKLDEIKFNFKN